jgi:sulfur carrier protein
MNGNRVTIRVNGEVRNSPATTLDELVRQLGLADTSGVAIAVNETIIPRSGWAGHALQTGDRVEIVGAVQGG